MPERGSGIQAGPSRRRPAPPSREGPHDDKSLVANPAAAALRGEPRQSPWDAGGWTSPGISGHGLRGPAPWGTRQARVSFNGRAREFHLFGSSRAGALKREVLWFLHIIAAPPLGPARADQAPGPALVAFREDDDQEPSVGLANRPLPSVLAPRVVLVIDSNQATRVIEGRDRRLERDAVLGEVRKGLLRIPVEPLKYSIYQNSAILPGGTSARLTPQQRLEGREWGRLD